MLRHPALCLALLLTCFLPPLQAQARIEQPLAAGAAAAVDEAVQAEMEKQGVIGVAIGILRQGKIVYLKGYGLADREKQLPVTTESVFNWASNSKPLAAVAAMQLVERKQLELDADVRRYVPEFPEKGSPITPRHLLCHQSGIPHYTNGKVIPTLRTYPQPKPFDDPLLALDRFNRSPLLFEPGTKTDYSSYAYILVSAMVQRAGQQPFDEQIRARIAKPLDLRSLQRDVETKDQPHWVIGYIKNRQNEVQPAPEQANDWKHGAGGYKSNVADFARWAQALLQRELVAQETERLMWTNQKTADGKATQWGLGFIIENQGGLKVSHNGKQNETTTRMVLYPEAKHGVVVMCNCSYANISAFSTAIYSALHRK